MQAIWNNQVIATADKEQLIRIEGNWYFPASSLKRDFFKPSATHTICPWKGEASYYHVVVDGQTNDDAAWYYPQPKDGATKKVGQDFTDFVAFWHGVDIAE